MDPMRYRSSILGLLLTLGFASQASATRFKITITNTSSTMFSAGVFTTQPLINIGAIPTYGSKQFMTYVYSKSDCGYTDGICGTYTPGQPFPCGFANETILLERWGLTNGVNAWIPNAPQTATVNGQTYHYFNTNDKATVIVDVAPKQRLYYIAKAGDFNTYKTDVVMATDASGALGFSPFDANGLPLQFAINNTIPGEGFALHGYAVSSSNQNDGTAGECNNECPSSSGSSETGCWVAIGSPAIGPKPAQLPTQPTQNGMTRAWYYAANAPGPPDGGFNPNVGYHTDGLALGTVNGSTQLVVEMEGADVDTDMSKGYGRISVLNESTGALTAHYDNSGTKADLMGFPTIESLTVSGTTSSNVLAAEFAPLVPGGKTGAYYYALNDSSGTISTTWKSAGWGYPGLWNMGMTTGDVRPDVTGVELVAPDWNGDIFVLSQSAGTLNSYNLATANDNLYGHVAIADVYADAKGQNEIIAFGATTGKVYVFDAPQTNGSTLTLSWASGKPGNGGAAFGSGPAVGNIDKDSQVEIVVATGNGVPGVYAYATAFGTTCKYSWTAPGGTDYSWTSPVIGDVDGDGVADIVVESTEGVLSVLQTPATGNATGKCINLSPSWTYTVGNGGSAWFTPALASLVTPTVSTTKTALNIVAANYNTLEVIDYNQRSPIYRYSDISASFYPSAIIEPGNASNGANIYVSGWSNGEVVKLQTPAGQPIPAQSWPTFMGSNTRIGSR
jgi:hypothetical protein